MAMQIFLKLVYSALILEDGNMGLLCCSITSLRGAKCLSWIGTLWFFGRFRNRVRGSAHLVQKGGFWRHDKCSHADYVRFVILWCLYWQILDNLALVVISDVQIAVSVLSGAGDMSTGAEIRSEKRWKRAVITRRFMPLLGHQLNPVEVAAVTEVDKCLSGRLTMLIIISIENTLTLVP